MTRKLNVAIVTGALILAAGAYSPALASADTHSATAAKAAKTYKNCTAMHKDYPHGVGKKGAVDSVRGKSKPVTNFKVSSKLYTANKKSDRDKDNIACEAH